MRDVPLKLDTITLARCLLFLEANNIKVQGRTLDTCIRLVLRSFTRSLVQDGAIPNETEDEAEATLARLLPERASPSTRVANVLKQVLEEEDREEISKAMDYEIPSTPVDIKEVPTQEEQPKIDLNNPPWDESKLVSWEDLKAMCPKDAYIVRAEQTDDWVLRQTLRIVYSGQDARVWGTDSIAKAIVSTYKLVEPYRDLGT